MNKKLILGLTMFFIAVVLIGLVFGWNRYQKTRVEAKEFQGQVMKVEQNTIYASGNYVGVRGGQPFTSESRDVKIIVLDETIFEKIITYMLGVSESAQSGGGFDFKNLKKENQPGKISDLIDNRQGQPIVVKTKQNIYNNEEFIAQKIEYSVFVYPGFDFED